MVNVPVHSIAAWPAQCFVETSGCQLHYRVAGSGPAVVLLHGLLGYSFCWRRNIDALARHFTVYALDMPGMGYSSCPPSYDGSFMSAAATVAQFCSALGIRRTSLVGHSFGGPVAIVCAARYPGLVSSMCLIAPANPFSRHAQLQVRLARYRVGQFLLETGFRFPRAFGGFLLRHRLYAHAANVDEHTINGYAGVNGRAEAMRAVKTTLSAWDMNSVRASFKDVHQPVLLIWGARDKVVPVYSAAPLAEALHARLEVLDDGAHMVNEETPDRVNALITGFLRQHADK